MDLITSYNQAVRLMERLERRARPINHGITLVWPDERHKRVYNRALARARRRYIRISRALFPSRY